MDVTIALPTLNEEGQIRSCLESLTQGIEEYEEGEVELIILDSHSEDNTRKIAREFEVVDEVYLIPKGILTGRHKGFEEASNSIVVSVDADAYYKKNWLNELIKPFKEEEVVATYGKAKAKGRGIEKMIRDVFNKLAIECFMPGANRAIRKETYFKLGGYSIPPNQKDVWKVMKEELYEFPKKLREEGEVIHAPEAVSYQADRNIGVRKKKGGAQWELKNFKSQFRVTSDFLRYASSVKKKKLKDKIKGISNYLL